MATLTSINRTEKAAGKGPLILREFTDIVRYWDVFTSLVKRDFKGRYRAKLLGILWSIGDPLVMMFVYTFIWTFVFPHHSIYAYPVVLLLGLCPHRFFANGVQGATNSLLDYSPLVKRVAFPRHLLPPAVLSSHLIHFFIEICLIAVVSLFYPGAIKFSKALVWLPLLFMIQLTYMTGMGFLTASLNVRYRDVQYVLRSAMLILYWMTPIFYPAKFIFQNLPKPYLWLYGMNPMAGVVIGYRNVIMKQEAPYLPFLAIGGTVAVVLLISGMISFRRQEGTFADYV